MTSQSSYGGLFDAFRDNRGPILYSDINRTPAVEDVQNVLIYVTFSTLFLAFLIIFPGIRKERFATFICVTISLFLGAVILLCNFGTSWHVAHATISSPYRAFAKDKIHADLGVHVGLNSVNITLRTNPLTHSRYDEINYNERFYWIGPTEMKQEHQRALAKGLPFPILTVAEYLSQDSEGFCWGRRYRQAGYYASLLLWTSFAAWILMNILLCAVPRYGLFMMQLTGVLMLLSVTLYAILLPKKGLVIPFEQANGSSSNLTFSFGWSFWLVLIAASIAVLIGALITIIDTLYPNKFSTILEIDYDTPYRYFVGNDAHVFGHMSADRLMDEKQKNMMAERFPTPPPSPRDFGKEAQTFGRASIRKAAAAARLSSSLSAVDSIIGVSSSSGTSNTKSIKINNPIVSEIQVNEVTDDEVTSTSNEERHPNGKSNYGFTILPEEGEERERGRERERERGRERGANTTTSDEYSLPSTSTKEEVTIELS